MQPATETSFDAASALIVGEREHQEDAVIADFPIGSDTGVIVLSDGMGGHAAGDVASKIVMTEVFCELKFQSGDPEGLAENVREVLKDALDGANECLAAHIAGNPDVRGMGATLLAAVFRAGRLNWISVGDSPLYLYRDGMLRQLNEDHSMAPQIDQMAASGMMDQDAARDHPDRNALTSVLAGCEVARIDCPEEPFELRNGDLVIAASDGLQSLEDNRIASLLRRTGSKSSAEIARALLDGIAELDDPEQDNTSIAVVRISQADVQDAVADAVRSAVSFAQAMNEDPAVSDEEEPVPVEVDAATEPQVQDGDDARKDDPALAAAIAAITTAFPDETDEEAPVALTEHEAAIPDDDTEEQIAEEYAADNETDGAVTGRDTPAVFLMPDDAPENLAADVDADADTDDGTSGEPVLAEDAAPPSETMAAQSAIEADDQDDNIFGSDMPSHGADAELPVAAEDDEDAPVPLFDREDAAEDPDAHEPGEAARVSLRAEPRNERRPGAPILRRIVVEASR